MYKLIPLTLFLFLGFMPLYGQKIVSKEIANLEYDLIPGYELPKQYILDGRTRTYPVEHPFRRMDIIFFLSIPITFYMLQNFLTLLNTMNVFLGNFNANVPRDILGFSMGEWTFLLSATVLIPSGVAIYDYVYVRDYPLIPPFVRDEFREVRMNFTVYRTKF